MINKLKALFLVGISFGILVGCDKKADEHQNKEEKPSTHAREPEEKISQPEGGEAPSHVGHDKVGESLTQMLEDALKLCKDSDVEVCHRIVEFKGYIEAKEDVLASNAIAASYNLCDGSQSNLCNLVNAMKKEWDKEHKPEETTEHQSTK